MPDYQLLIFDWDGTLVDSIGRIVESMHRAAEACGLPQLSDEAIKSLAMLRQTKPAPPSALGGLQTYASSDEE